MANDKKYLCEKCGRPINHKGNCLKCNLTAKRECKKKITARVSGSEDILLSEILKIKSVDHKKIQLQLQSICSSLGYFVELEKKIQAKRPGRIDLFAKKDNFSIGIEIDHSLVRLKSIDKLNTFKSDLAIFILRSKNIKVEKNEQRLNLIKVNSLLINLADGSVRKLNKK